MVHLAPGDPIAAVMPAESSQAEIEATKRAYGFDKPLPVQYLVWLGRVAQGDLGRSIATRRAVILDVRDALANSLVLALSSSLLAFALGVALGLLAAFRQGRALDKLASAIAVVGVSVPHYWAGIILIIIFSVQLNWLPAMGAANEPGVLPYLRHIALPTVALSLIPLGVITRVVRSAALDILSQEFVLALRAKGLAARRGGGWPAIPRRSPPAPSGCSSRSPRCSRRGWRPTTRTPARFGCAWRSSAPPRTCSGRTSRAGTC